MEPGAYVQLLVLLCPSDLGIYQGYFDSSQKLFSQLHFGFHKIIKAHTKLKLLC